MTKLHTKIYGTIGPACCDVGTLTKLFENGMTGMRINLSHTGLREADAWLANIRRAYQRFLESCGQPDGSARTEGPAILMDLRGPELRIGRLAEPLQLADGELVHLTEDQAVWGGDGVQVRQGPREQRQDGGVQERQGGFGQKQSGCDQRQEIPCIPVQVPLSELLSRGQQILMDDGKLLLEFESFLRDENRCVAECKVLRGGLLRSGKSLAFPSVSFRAPTLTGSDLENIRVAKEYGVTGVMLPFVRDREDLLCLKRALREAGAERIRIFAKIENLQGVNHLPELLGDCDEVVIARGDLGNAAPLWRLPVIQAQIAALCRERHVPFMVVTQMLASMERSAVPTRAEVSDIFRAVSEGAASVMLTGETAAGDYPAEAIKYLVNTVKEAENYIKC